MEKNAKLESIIAEIQKKYLSYGEDREGLIGRAYEYAVNAHRWHKRKSGEPYITHPVSATRELMVIQPDLINIIATLLHDTISDGNGTLVEIESLFWIEVRNIVEALDKIGLLKYRWNKTTIERLQRTMLAMASDVRSIFVKFADRIDNLRTLQYHENKDTARRIADESLSIYAPIATRLGLYAYKETMETLALRELDIEGYLQVTWELADYTVEQERFLTQSVENIRSALPQKYHNTVSYRVKSVYSIYRKLRQNRAKSIREIYDVFALRIVVDDVSDCYAVLGIIHGKYTPITDRFKDFIAVPKPNWYQSLHTTVLGFEWYRQPIEIQIRTKEMDVYAEEGTANHVLYKVFGDTMQRHQWQEDMVQMTMDVLLSQWSLLGKKVIFPTLFVFSPKGDVFELPIRSTPVDFAYAIHSDVGHHTMWARVNGMITPLDTCLQDGDVVEIITNNQTHPSAQWLDFVVSSKAKSHISIEIKRISGVRDRLIQRGREMLLSTFLQAGIVLDQDLWNFTQYFWSPLVGKKQEEFLYHIGQWIRKPASFLPYVKKEKKKTIHVATHDTHIIIGGEKNIPHELSQCCSPVFPDPIMALMRTWGKCMIHKVHCHNLVRSNPARVLHAFWQTTTDGHVLSTTLLFSKRDDLLSALTRLLYEMNVTIIDMSSSQREYDVVEIHLTLQIPDHDNSFMNRFIDRVRFSFPEFLFSNDQ